MFLFLFLEEQLIRDNQVGVLMTFVRALGTNGNVLGSVGKNNNSLNHFNFRKCRLANIKDTYKAAVCIGRQPNSEVWVFGPDLQLAANG